MRVSALPKTWLLDLDGVIVSHNGHLAGEDRLLPGVVEFCNQIEDHDTVILLSARDETYREQTLSFLRAANVKVDMAIFGLPTGERILLNDRKPLGLKTAIAINLQRDVGLGGLKIIRDPSI